MGAQVSCTASSSSSLVCGLVVVPIVVAANVATSGSLVGVVSRAAGDKPVSASWALGGLDAWASSFLVGGEHVAHVLVAKVWQLPESPEINRPASESRN